MEQSQVPEFISIPNQFEEFLRGYQDLFNEYRTLVTLGKELKRLITLLPKDRQRSVFEMYKNKNIYGLRTFLKDIE